MNIKLVYPISKLISKLVSRDVCEKDEVEIKPKISRQCLPRTVAQYFFAHEYASIDS